MVYEVRRLLDKNMHLFHDINANPLGFLENLKGDKPEETGVFGR